jgi:hypothetical protein
LDLALLADVLREGRVLIDRDHLWAELQLHRDEVIEAGLREADPVAGSARATVAAARPRLTTATVS